MIEAAAELVGERRQRREIVAPCRKPKERQAAIVTATPEGRKRRRRRGENRRELPRRGQRVQRGKHRSAGGKGWLHPRHHGPQAPNLGTRRDFIASAPSFMLWEIALSKEQAPGLAKATVADVG